nr:CPBP family intramembrane glutamic endopeptidase [uncultured Dyadobacter sp.]
MQKTSSVLLLIGVVLVSMAMGVLITHFIVFTPKPYEQSAVPSLKHLDQWYLRMFLHAVNHFFTFLLPAIFFWLVVENRTCDELSTSPVDGVASAWIAVAVVILLIPVNKQIIDWNQNIQLPKIFTEVERWMRAKEQEKTLLTQGLLRTDSLSKLFVSLMVFAFIGPLGEELFFRGVLQRKLNEWGLSSFKSIWAAAVIFSLIHFQFYGFFPRLLLGALFGYLFYWSGNICIPVVAHVVNNGLFVLTAFVHERWPWLGANIEIVIDNWLSCMISVALSALALFFFWRRSFKRMDVT